MYRSWAVVLLVVATARVSVGAELRWPAARVLEVKGTVSIVSPNKIARPAATFSILYAGDQLVTAADARATLIFRSDGHVERVAAAGTFQVACEGCQPRTGVEQVVMSDPNRAAVAKVSQGPGGVVQGAVVVVRNVPPSGESAATADDDARESAARPICPICDATILNLQPTFSWPADAKTKTYTLNLYFRGNRVWSANSETARVEYAAAEPLQSGAMYSWEVTAAVEGETVKVCEGVFRTASERQRAAAEDLPKLLAKPDASLVALAALWYKQNRFVDEAIAAHRQLTKLGDDAAVYWALSELCGQAGRQAEAKVAARKAAELEKQAGGGKEQPAGSRPAATGK